MVLLPLKDHDENIIGHMEVLPEVEGMMDQAGQLGVSLIKDDNTKQVVGFRLSLL